MSTESLFAIVGYGFVQLLALVSLIIVRYHFRLVALPNDHRATILMKFFTIGTLLFFLSASGVLVFSFLI